MVASGRKTVSPNVFGACFYDCFRLVKMDVDLSEGVEFLRGVWGVCLFLFFTLNSPTQFKQAWEDQSSVFVNSEKENWEISVIAVTALLHHSCNTSIHLFLPVKDRPSLTHSRILEKMVTIELGIQI